MIYLNSKILYNFEITSPKKHSQFVGLAYYVVERR
jgi:hypothetical protein